MKKNMNENFEITVDEMTEIFGDTPVEMSFREVKEGMDSFFGLMGLTVELVNLIRKEDELKKHHRAYLHVREDIAECANEATEVIGGKRRTACLHEKQAVLCNIEVALCTRTCQPTVKSSNYYLITVKPMVSGFFICF